MAEDPRAVLSDIVEQVLLKGGRVSQRKAAEELGVSQGTIGDWLNKKRLPTDEYARRLATYLGLHVVEFWAKIYSYPLRAAEEGDRTWAEIGASLSDEEFAELFQNVDDLTLHRRLVLISQILQDRFHDRQNGG